MAENSLIMYHVHDENKKIQLEVLALSLSIPTRELKAADLHEQVGKLAGIKNVAPKGATPLLETEQIPALFSMPEVIIFSGVPNAKLDEFLYSYKNVGLTPTKLKAVVTPKNSGWSLYKLITEISQEAVRMDKMVKKSN
jgi:hypothetical protein